jgi:hypothetical protein
VHSSLLLNPKNENEGNISFLGLALPLSRPNCLESENSLKCKNIQIEIEVSSLMLYNK